MENLTINEYREAMMQSLALFSDYWVECAERIPQDYPERMGMPEWKEQFEIWRELQ